MPPNQSDDDLRSYWTEVRAPTRRRRTVQVAFEPPPVENLLQWATNFTKPGRPALCVIPGPSYERNLLLQKYLDPKWAMFRPDCIEDVLGSYTQDWIDQGVLANFTQRISTLRIPSDEKPPTSWNLLWDLSLVDDFLVDEPLRTMVDREFYLIHKVYHAIWEARFLARESTDQLSTFLQGLARWLTNEPLTDADREALRAVNVTRRIESPQERADVLLFLLTLAEHNSLVNRAVFTFDGLERLLGSAHRAALRQLDAFLGDVDRWVKLGCPIGIFLGFNATRTNLSALKRLNPKLHARVQAGLEWTQ